MTRAWRMQCVRPVRSLSALAAGLVLLGLLAPDRASAQELRQAASDRGVLFGAPLFDLHDPLNIALLEDQMAVGTLGLYWWDTRPDVDTWDWSRAESALQLAHANGWPLHGHPLIWAVDSTLPNWVLEGEAELDASELMVTHFERVIAEFEGDVTYWDVVNEAIDDQGGYRDNFWNRAQSAQFLVDAFKTARRAAPEAVLIYNDYGMESNAAKWATLYAMLREVRALGGEIDGVGWQLHTDPDTVLRDPGFKLRERMAEVSALGLTNYITELDVWLKDSSPGAFEDQRLAYEKIAHIFLANPTRGELFQTWGLSDKYTWLNNRPGADPPYYPLPFSTVYEKKPAYWGLVEAFRGETEVPPDVREVRIENRAQGRYLHQNRDGTNAPVSLQPLVTEWLSQRWFLEPAPQGGQRLRCAWGGANYLNASGEHDGAPARVFDLVLDWWSEQWIVEPTAVEHTVRLRNRWTGGYLVTSDEQEVVTTQNVEPEDERGHWTFHTVDSGLISQDDFESGAPAPHWTLH